MMKVKVVIIALGVLVMAVLLWLLLAEKRSLKTPNVPTLPTNQQADQPSEPLHGYLTTSAPKQEPGGPYAPADPRWADRRRRLEADRYYEWRTRIEFYGKVVDQDGQAIEGVIVKMNWTTLTKSGTENAERLSDASGGFSITGIQGKNFGIRSLTKSGYVAFQQSNPNSFEYAGFWEPSFHVPDKNNPVIFRLRKKGEAAPLVEASGKTVQIFGETTEIKLPPELSAKCKILVTIFENTQTPRQWRGHIEVEGGGVAPALEEFPFEAPDQGYKSSLNLSESDPRPPGWQDAFQGGRYFIKTDVGFGLLEIEQIVGRKTLRYKFIANTSGEQNLEPQ